MSPAPVTFPVLRWFSLLWMVVWLPAYFRVWGWANLLHLCDVAVILSFVGIWLANPLLLSSQAVNSLAAGFLWVLDVGSRLTTGRFLIGGTEYMWDALPPLGASPFHISHRPAVGPSLDAAPSWLRPARVGVAGRYCRRSLDRLPLPVCERQHELRVPRSALPSRLGTCSGPSCNDFHPTRGVDLLAYTSAA